MKTDPAAIAWAAGLFEGEGSIAIKNNGLTISSTDRDVIDKFWKVVEGVTVTNIRSIQVGETWKGLTNGPQ